MIKRFLPLVLMFAWAPTALAYPPCKPSDSLLQLLPLGDAQPPAPGSPPPWFQASYAIVGDQYVIGLLRQGKCKDRMPVPAANASTGILGLTPSFSPIRGYGIVSLPELPSPAVAFSGLNLRYRLDFTIDNAPLLNAGDWMDVAQLDFAQDRQLAGAGWPVSVYRVRKIQQGANTIVQVIEARAVDGADFTSKPPPTVNVVAEIPLTGAYGKTAIALRWTQHVQTPRIAESESTMAPMYDINATMEVLWLGQQNVEPANAVLYSTALPRQWANELSMGLLDYNAPGGRPYSSNFRVEADRVHLDAETL